MKDVPCTFEGVRVGRSRVDFHSPKLVGSIDVEQAEMLCTWHVRCYSKTISIRRGVTVKSGHRAICASVLANSHKNAKT